jgi:hypothetical protein
VVGHGDAFPNSIVIRFWFVEVMKSVEMLEFVTEAVNIAFSQGSKAELLQTGIQGRILSFNLDVGWREGGMSGVYG